jgi:hypothetical protein
VSDVIPCSFDGHCPAGETCNTLRVLDVDEQFNTLNSSHHAVKGPSYVAAANCVAAGDPHTCCTGAGTGPTCDLPFGSNVDSAIQGVRNDLNWGSTLDCEDCHYGEGSRPLNGHGTPLGRYMLRDKDGNDVARPVPMDNTDLLNTICFRCHIDDAAPISGDPNNYSLTYSAFDQHTQGSHIDNTRNLFGISCLNCHGGGEFGGIHGVSGPVTDDDSATSYNPNVFTWGSGLDLVDDWTTGAAGVTCSARAMDTLVGNCTQHTTNGTANWRDATQTRTYRDP